MNRLQELIAWVDGSAHRRRYGHQPDWLYLGEGNFGRTCVLCLKGGHRKRLDKPFALRPATFPL